VLYAYVPDQACSHVFQISYVITGYFVCFIYQFLREKN
jgi:hypothetical protein